MSCPDRLIASVIMLVSAGEGGTESTDGVDIGEDCWVCDANIRRRFAGGMSADDLRGAELGGGIGESSLSLARD